MGNETITETTRIVEAPQAELGMHGFAILDVVVQQDEVVVWHWAHHTDGTSWVTGYTICKADEIGDSN
jgi:hypothetical protein